MPKRIPKRVIIFAVIGVFNTLVDFSLYLVLLHFRLPIVAANVIATSVALVVSFLLNSRLTFQVEHLGIRRFLGFLIVTLFGLWVLQTGIIYALTPTAEQIVKVIGLAGVIAGLVRQLLPKLVATAVTLVWNYVWYSKVIFKNPK